MELFSTVLAIGVLIIFFLSVFLLIATVCKFTFVRKVSYEAILAGMGAIALISTVSVLLYQYEFQLAVCELCWWQRIFMFPIEIVVFVALLTKQKHAHVTVGALATIGALIAGYHYYNHFQNLVLGKEVTLPCSQVGLVPSCSDFSFTVFGFVTIPGMALLAFLSIILLAFAAHRRRL